MALQDWVDFWPSRVSGAVFAASLALLYVGKVVLTAALLAVRAQLPSSAFKPSKSKKGDDDDDGATLVLDPNLVWFALHALANAVVCGYAWGDTVHVLARPAAAFRPSENEGHAIVMATHVFHCLFFDLDAADMLHHGVSVGIVGSMGYLVRWGALLHAIDFFICGLPGGLDYAMLAAAKAGALPGGKITAKRVNLWLQVGVRWPGILLVIYNGLTCKLNGAHPGAAAVGWAPLLTVALLHGWNGLYYAQRVVGNAYVAEHVLRHGGEGGAGAAKRGKKLE